MSATPARRVAYEVLRRVFEHGAYADRTLRSAASRERLEGRERALAQRLAYGAVQRRGSSDHLIVALAGRPIQRLEPALLAALRLGLFELLFDDGSAEHAAVDQAVELAKGGRDGGRRHRGAGLVNAVLRRAIREGRGILERDGGEGSPERASITHSIPIWIAELWWRERGPETALMLMRAANEPPRRCYRLTPAGLAAGGIEALERAGVGLAMVGPGSDSGPGAAAADLVRLTAPAALCEVSGGEWEAVEAAVRRGELVPQSPGSAAAAAVLEVQPGDRVLDLCAAPGIKTTQLAAAAGPEGKVVAVERDASRAAELERLCAAVGADNVTVLAGDGTELELGSGYDRVLVDAPCSGLGTLASRPDVRWRRTPAELDGTVAGQAALLGAGAGALAPGGSLVYSVCTISEREGAAVLTGALADRSGLQLDDLGREFPALADRSEQRSLQLLPGRDAADGFFIARLTGESA